MADDADFLGRPQLVVTLKDDLVSLEAVGELTAGFDSTGGDRVAARARVEEQLARRGLTGERRGGRDEKKCSHEANERQQLPSELFAGDSRIYDAYTTLGTVTELEEATANYQS
jgi:hypothetical protein